MVDKKETEQFSNPQNVPLILNVEDIKIPQDTVDDRNDLIEQSTPVTIDTYGRPRLDLTKEEQAEIYRQKDKENLRVIEKSFRKGEINKETRDFLCEYFSDSAGIFQAFKESVDDLFGCPPTSIKYINLLTGKIDEETPYFDEHVGPDTTMVYEYQIDAPWRPENKIPNAPMERISVSVVLPMIKNVNRAIEKVKINGKYDLERQKELAKLKPGQTIEEAKLDKAKLRTPLQKMKDILRCTILAPRYDDVLALYEQSLDLSRATKSSRPSKYLDNDIKHAKEFLKNIKNYRDMKNSTAL